MVHLCCPRSANALVTSQEQAVERITAHWQVTCGMLGACSESLPGLGGVPSP